ncbi:interferon-induced protein 44-like [Argopecten irradians]|uniref:interferon-induced protein 44-like n=1 Tax=Argopecten irradians TaxID=31199 RepID=UPI003721829D
MINEENMTEFTETEQMTFRNMIGGGPKSFTKLYSAKEDGIDTTIFHRMCDNKGPTLTLVYTKAGEVYGGYTSVSWQSYSNKHVYDSQAFIFNLGNEEDVPIMFRVQNPESAVLLDERRGPTFGGRHDTSTVLDKKRGPTFGGGPDIKLHIEKEDGEDELMLQISLGSYLRRDERVKNMVIFRVHDVPHELLELQWRSEPIFDEEYLQTLKDEIEDYWPLKDMGVAEEALQHVNILFIGPVGAGKSSFLNSVESFFRGHVTMTAGAGSRDKSVTSAFRRYRITASDNRRALKFRLCDCRGLENGVDFTQDIESILEGHMPNNYVINTTSALKGNMHGYNNKPKLEDKIHCVVYVFDADAHSDHADIHDPFISADVKKQIVTVQESADQKGIPQLILLNKVDRVCKLTRESTSAVYRSTLIRERCLDAAECLGLPPMTILPMKNYFMEPSTIDEISILALYNIRQMLRAADTFLRVNHLNELRTDKYEALF